MQITIWRQFSSNHSSNFTAVGVFESPQRAAEVVDILRQMLKTIHEAQEQRSPAYGKVTDAEIEFSKQFRVNWNEQSLDWAYQYEFAVKQMDNFVFIQNVQDQTHNGVRPIDALIQHFGGKPIVSQEEHGTAIKVDLSCTAPNENTAIAIENDLLPLFSSGEVDDDGSRIFAFETIPPPWKEFADKTEHGDFAYDRSDLYDGYLIREDAQIRLTDLHFSAIGYGLPALRAYLKARGCAQINFVIRDDV